MREGHWINDSHARMQINPFASLSPSKMISMCALCQQKKHRYQAKLERTYTRLPFCELPIAPHSTISRCKERAFLLTVYYWISRRGAAIQKPQTQFGRDTAVLFSRVKLNRVPCKTTQSERNERTAQHMQLHKYAHTSSVAARCPLQRRKRRRRLLFPLLLLSCCQVDDKYLRAGNWFAAKYKHIRWQMYVVCWRARLAAVELRVNI